MRPYLITQPCEEPMNAADDTLRHVCILASISSLCLCFLA